jgi:Protein of unknown function (DUF2742)
MTNGNGPPGNDGGPGSYSEATTTATADKHADTEQLTALTSSQQVSFWPVHEFVAPALDRVGWWPMVGTPAWCLLDDDDPAKGAALFDAARHWALRLETLQQARCEASREISAAADWSAVARQIFVHNSFYVARPWLRRVLA